MIPCSEKALALQALFDGELDGINSVALEDHMRECAACAGAFTQMAAIRAKLAQPGLRATMPATLRARIEALGVPAKTYLVAPLPRRPFGAWLTGGALGALAASLAMLIVVPHITDPDIASPDIASEVVASHIRSLQAAHLVDVQTSDRHTVKPWFNGRVDVAPPVVDLVNQGFALIGGRLDYVGGRAVPALVYRHNQHNINLFIRGGSAASSIALRTEQHGGYSMAHWGAAGLDYWAVSDMDLSELEQFAAAFKREAAKVR
ncbi:MAG: anti-sigma factor [Pseudomonadota bacterium]